MRLLPTLLLSVALATGLFVANTDGAHAADSPTKAKAPPVPLLWKVSDADNSVYLLGSFHMLESSDYPLSKDVDAAFADAESLVFELPPEEMGSPQLGIRMAQAALRTDGTQLRSDLKPEVAKALDDWLAANTESLDKAKLPPQVLQMFEPWFVGLMVSVVEAGKQGLDPKLGLDAHFVEAAKAAGKAASGFETGDEQIAFLDGMGKAEQLQMLEESLEEAKTGKGELRALHAAWRAGDARRLSTEMAEDMRRDYPALYQRINVARNDAWVPKVEQRLKQGGSDDTLVVVGALHLLGKDGVVEKLRAKGYNVERICSACGK